MMINSNVGRLHNPPPMPYSLPMNRRTLICGLGSLAALLPAIGYAQSPRSDLLLWGLPWQHIPQVVVVSTESDSRLPAIGEAIDFWNAEFAKLGSAFRLGSPTHIDATIPRGNLPVLQAPLAEKVLSRMAKILSGMAPTGDVIVVLSNDADLRPFSQARPDFQKVIVAIPDLSAYPGTSRSVVRNAAAHELGHAIGLGHNDDADTLMCGGAQCGFKAFSEWFLPITGKEKAKLLEMYPPNWEPKPSRKWITDPPYPLREHAERLGGIL
jgi:hypothetical protein